MLVTRKTSSALVVGGTVGFLVALGLGVAAGVGRAAAGPVEGTEFRLVDQNGKIRGVWGLQANACRLSLLDTNGAARIEVCVTDHPSVRLLGDNGGTAALLSQDELDGTDFDLMDQRGVLRLRLLATKSASRAFLNDEDGKTRVDAICYPTGDVELSVSDDKGKTTWSEKAKHSELAPLKKKE